MSKPVHNGTNVLNRFLDGYMSEGDSDAFRTMLGSLLSGVSFWIEPTAYRHLPILMPYAVRDGGARRRGRHSAKEEWGSPSPAGFARDDNTWVKNLANSADVIAGNGIVPVGQRIRGGFVACHIWRTDSRGYRSIESERLYSFVPNLVWLPAPLAVLTDHEGSFAQQYMQRLSMELYRPLALPPRLKAYAEESWRLLSPPQLPATAVDTQVNFLQLTSRTLNNKLRHAEEAASALRTRATGGLPTGKAVSTRFTSGLVVMQPPAVQAAADFLTQYTQAVRASLETES